MLVWMNINPYASFLNDRDPLAVIAATAAELARLIDTIGPDRAIEAPAPGKWSARDIVCHMADTEIVFAFRLRQALAEDHHVVQPFDQDSWAKCYAKFDVGAALGVFSSVREWNLTLIRAAGPDAYSKPLTHPERGTMTFQTLVETMGGHDGNHVKQLEAIARETCA
jgi:hypothetical protein